MPYDSSRKQKKVAGVEQARCSGEKAFDTIPPILTLSAKPSTLPNFSTVGLNNGNIKSYTPH